MGMDGVELVMDFEERFGLHIPDAEAGKMMTPRHVIDWLLAAQAQGKFFTAPEPPPKNTWWRELRKLPPLKSSRLPERTYTRNEIAAHVRAIITDILGVENFSEDDRFVEDLGMG
jgi:acyl carrier protein